MYIYIPPREFVCDSLQCVTVCCSMLQCVAVCWSVLQRVTACCSVLQHNVCSKRLSVLIQSCS